MPANFIINQSYQATRALSITIRGYVADEAGGPSPAGTRLGFTVEWISALQVVFAQFDANWTLYIDRDNRTRAITATMKTLNEQLFDMIRAMQRRVKGSYALTDVDYIALGITVPKGSRSPAVKPEDVPITKVDRTGKRVIHVTGVAQDGESSLRNRMPRGYLLTIMICILVVGSPKPAADDFVLWGTQTSSRAILTFEPADIGKEVWIRMRYSNAAGEGPWSEAIRAIII